MILLELLDAATVAGMLDKSELWVKRQAKAGVLPHRRIGRAFKFTEQDIVDYIESARRGTRTIAQPVDGFAKKSQRRAS